MRSSSLPRSQSSRRQCSTLITPNRDAVTRVLSTPRSVRELPISRVDHIDRGSSVRIIQYQTESSATVDNTRVASHGERASLAIVPAIAVDEYLIWLGWIVANDKRVRHRCVPGSNIDLHCVARQSRDIGGDEEGSRSGRIGNGQLWLCSPVVFQFVRSKRSGVTDDDLQADTHARTDSLICASLGGGRRG